jgi:hypothetical protein
VSERSLTMLLFGKNSDSKAAPAVECLAALPCSCGLLQLVVKETRSDAPLLKARAVMSAAVPGVKPTIRRIGRDGQESWLRDLRMTARLRSPSAEEIGVARGS